MSPVDMLSLRAKSLNFRFSALGKEKYRLTKDGVMGGGYQGKVSECNAYLDGWLAFKEYVNHG